jgi:hypothetical protein
MYIANHFLDVDLFGVLIPDHPAAATNLGLLCANRSVDARQTLFFGDAEYLMGCKH